MASMQVVVKGKNLEVTDALRSYTESKLAKIEKFLKGEKEVLAEVLLRTEREQHIAELTLDLRGLILRGEGKTTDMYASIDEGVERIERQFAKFKAKIQQRMQGPKISEVPIEGSSQAEVLEEAPRIVKTKRFAFKPMDAEEAAMQMEMLGHDFFVFSNGATEEVNVIYKRRDGNYGLIEPDF